MLGMAEPMPVAAAAPWRPPDTFAARLRQLRFALDNVSVEAIAAACGIKDSTWSSWENGRCPRGMDEVVKAIEAGVRLYFEIEVDRNWLMWGTAFGYYSDDPALASGYIPDSPASASPRKRDRLTAITGEGRTPKRNPRPLALGIPSS